MRTTTTILASSVYFTGSTPAFSTTGTIGPVGTASSGAIGNLSFFGSQGSLGGPTLNSFGIGIALQANFGTLGPASSAFANYGGTLNLRGSNVLETPMFVTVASTAIASTGSFMLRDSAPWYKYVDFQFIPNSAAASTGLVTVALTVKGNT